MDLKTVVKHLANGSFGHELCLVCLLPLTGDKCENVLTLICKKDDEYCIADVLREICQIKILDTDHYNICCGCFQSASEAYKFYLQAKHSHQILDFYTEQLLNNIEDLEIVEEDSKRLLCIPLPAFTTEVSGFNYGFDSMGTRKMGDDDEITETVDIVTNEEVVITADIATKEEVVIKDDQTLLYSVHDGALQDIELNKDSDDENVLMIINEKPRRKRVPMMSISCLHCPVKYRFVSKLKEHEKKMHNTDIYYCKICKLVTDKKDYYEEHLSTHIGDYQCRDCNAVYRKKSSLIEHSKCHEICEVAKLENGNICEICGVILENETALEDHRALRHVNRFTCYYCGKMYRGQLSFEIHIKKHEKLLKSSNQSKKQDPKSKPPEPENSSSSKRCICGVCGKSFVDERSLLWHQRLHNNERPFVCNVCGRGFVSANRRNQHRTCAHSPPARRCPLCPALFHLRSMVNSHLKKVHLNRHNKRRNRNTKHKDVFWRTETVPIQDLSVSIQNEVLEIQSSQDKQWDNLTTKQPQGPPIPTVPSKQPKGPPIPTAPSKQPKRPPIPTVPSKRPKGPPIPTVPGKQPKGPPIPTVPGKQPKGPPILTVPSKQPQGPPIPTVPSKQPKGPPIPSVPSRAHTIHNKITNLPPLPPVLMSHDKKIDYKFFNKNDYITLPLPM